MPDRDVDREDYTWAMACKDLALSSRLTLQEAGSLCRELEGLVHPYDALPILIPIVGTEPSAGLLGANLRRLMHARWLVPEIHDGRLVVPAHGGNLVLGPDGIVFEPDEEKP